MFMTSLLFIYNHLLVDDVISNETLRSAFRQCLIGESNETCLAIRLDGFLSLTDDPQRLHYEIDSPLLHLEGECEA